MEQTEKNIRPEIRDANIAYEIGAASERQSRDRLIVTWRDLIHAALQSTPTDYQLLHQVMDSMDVFLSHAGGRRK